MKMPPRKIVGGGGESKKEMMALSREDPVYKEKRNKNNDAVKKSRLKTKVRSEEIMNKVSILKQVGVRANSCHNFLKSFLVTEHHYNLPHLFRLSSNFFSIIMALIL